MGKKVSKNSRVDRGRNVTKKNMVKVIKAFKTNSNTASYTFREDVVEENKVQDIV